MFDPTAERVTELVTENEMLRNLLDDGARFIHRPDRSCEPSCTQMWKWAEGVRSALQVESVNE